MTSWIEPLESRQLLSGTPHIAASGGPYIFSGTMGSTSAAQQVTLKNMGSGKMAIQSITIGGADASQFAVTMKRIPSKLGHGSSFKVKVAFKPTAAGVETATLDVATNDPNTPIYSVPLRGLGGLGLFESNEPSLQRILDTLQIPVNVGDRDPSTNTLDGPGPSDEVPMQLMQKAGKGPVRIQTLASYSWLSNPVAQFGWYSPTQPAATLHKLFTILKGQSQKLLPKTSGKLKFDPGNAIFGIYSTWPFQSHSPVYTQDVRNTWADPNGPDRRHEVRFYPYKTPDGKTVPNTYIAAVEEGFNSDYQDAVLLISNVAPVK
ncbi:MAG: hypothetical protein JWN24_3880 [Phycisphaerales bacterium]|nr:hypothetical protein [Phycisphaerales bacterium]